LVIKIAEANTHKTIKEIFFTINTPPIYSRVCSIEIIIRNISNKNTETNTFKWKKYNVFKKITLLFNIISFKDNNVKSKVIFFKCEVYNFFSDDFTAKYVGMQVSNMPSL